MAINISIPTTFGVNASYWKVSSVSVNNDRLAVYANMDGYYDQDARSSGLQALTNKTFSWAFEAESFVDQISSAANIIEYVYSKIKESEEFMNGEDV